jgi:hypothetical protein
MIAPCPQERPAAYRDLPPAPRFCATAQLTDGGLALGEGVVVAPLVRRRDGAAALAVDGREAEIFALLSLAHGEATSDSIGSTLANPAETVPARDSRLDEKTGARRDDPATAYVNSDGSYVVVNDMDRTVVQLSNRNNPDWRAPWTKGNP